MKYYLKMGATAKRLRETSLSKWYRRLIANWPSYQETPTGEVSFRIKMWLRVCSSLFSALLRMSFRECFKLFTSAKHVSSLAGEILVIANGPSVAQLSRERLQDFINSGGRIFAMNGYLYSELANDFPPDYYFLTDPAIWLQPLPNDRKFQEKLEFLVSRNWVQTTIVQPVNQRNFVEKHSKYIYLSHLNTSGFLPLKNPFFIWGLAPSTVLLALAVARRMGCGRVFFAGLDGDSYRYFYIDSQGLLKWEDSNHHFYNESDSHKPEILESSFEGILVDPRIIPTIGDALYAEAILRRDFMRLSRGQFINSTPSRYFDLGKRDDF